MINPTSHSSSLFREELLSVGVSARYRARYFTPVGFDVFFITDSCSISGSLSRPVRFSSSILILRAIRSHLQVPTIYSLSPFTPQSVRQSSFLHATIGTRSRAAVPYSLEFNLLRAGLAGKIVINYAAQSAWRLQEKDRPPRDTIRSIHFSLTTRHRCIRTNLSPDEYFKRSSTFDVSYDNNNLINRVKLQR